MISFVHRRSCSFILSGRKNILFLHASHAPNLVSFIEDRVLHFQEFVLRILQSVTHVRKVCLNFSQHPD
jgi:hypothetical protein